MEGQHLAGANPQASSLAIGLNGPPFLSSLMSSEPLSNGLNLIDIPLTLSAFNGYNPNLALSASDDLLSGSSVNLSLNSLSDASVFKMSDNGGLLMPGDSMSKNNDSSKLPLELMVSSDNLQGQSSPAIVLAQSGAQFQSVVSGGDKMLSAVNNLHFGDAEMLGDSGFDGGTSSLSQFDDGLLSSLGSSTGQVMAGGSSFDLFDGGVTETLSLSPQPFQDSGLMATADSQSPVLDTGLIPQQSDSTSENNSVKSSGNKTPSSSVSSPDQSKYTPSQCPVCGKTFNNIGALAKHRLTHSDERKYVCDVCSKGFKRQDHLNGHRMTHLEKKPFECQLPSCDKGYCDARSLRRHLEQHHHLDPETIAAHVHASMAAAGIPPPTPRSGGGASKKDNRSKQLSSPHYSPGSATPTPSPGASGAGNAFHFESQQKQQQQQQQDLLVSQQIQQQKMILQQQKQHQLQEELKTKGNTNLNMDSQRQFQVQLQQKQSKPQTQHQQVKSPKTPQQQTSSKSPQAHKAQQQKQPADMVAVMQQVQQLQQQIQQQHQLEMQRKKEREANSTAHTSSGKTSASHQQQQQQQQGDASWQDRAGVYTFVSTPTSSEMSPASRSDQSPGGGGMVMAGGQTSNPVSPATSSGTPTGSQARSPITTSTSKPGWFPADAKTEEAAKNQAYCAICDRYFKNAAALNGHMRCHGGFLKQSKEKDSKKSPVRKNSNSSSSDMGPPLRRPPHISTPSPQSAISRTSPTTPTPSSFSPSPGSVPSDQHVGPVELLTVSSPADHQLLQQQDATGGDLAPPRQKHKHLQEQLSSHILKRRMSGEQQVRRQQQQQQQKMQSKTIQQQPQQPNQQQITFLEEHIKSQQQQQQHQQHQYQEQSHQNIQMLQPNFLDNDTTGVTIVEPVPSTRSMSPHQGEHIQRLVQSFQQVEELQRQSQQQAQQLNVSAEQLEQIRQQHKLLGLPPLNPQQLHYQLQEQQAQQAQLVQAQIREQQQMQQQQQQQLQEHHQAALVMSTSSSPSSAQILDPQSQTGPLAQHLNSSADAMGLNQQGLLSPSALSTQHVITNPVNPTATVTPLNTSVQQILAALDPSVVTAAGINLGDHHSLLLQLHRQQQDQGDAASMLSNSNRLSPGVNMTSNVAGGLVSGGQFHNTSGSSRDQTQTALLQTALQQIPQILLQPPDADDLSGVPTISIPDSVLADHMGGGMLHQHPHPQHGQLVISQQGLSEQEQIEQIQNGLMASFMEKQQQQQQAMLTGGVALAHPHVAHSLDSPSVTSSITHNSFINIQDQQFQHNFSSQPLVKAQQPREKVKPSQAGHTNPKQQHHHRSHGGFHNTTTAPSSTPSGSSPSTSLAVARNTDAAVAQILKNISNSMAGAENSGALAAAAAAAAVAASAASASSGDVLGETTSSATPGLDPMVMEDQNLSFKGLRDPYHTPSSLTKAFKYDSIKQDVMLSSAVSSDPMMVMNDPLSSSSREDSMLAPYNNSVVQGNSHNPHNPRQSHVPSNGTIKNKLRRMSADLETAHYRRGNPHGSQHQNILPHTTNQTSDSKPHHVMLNPSDVEGFTNLGPGNGAKAPGAGESRLRMRSKSGDVQHQHKYSRSKSIDHSTILRHRSLTGDSLTQPRVGLRTNSPSHYEDIFARSDGADVFRNPSSLPSPLKIKRKHRPAPLYIPPQFGFFQSRLRSPRVISGGVSSADRAGGLGRNLHTGHTPPPYTPPPMLSPFRSGSGLFCTLQSSQPQTPRSAPVSGKILLNRKGSTSSVKSELGIEPFTEHIEAECPPETDTEAHINIGPEYQAVLPELRERRPAKDVQDKDWVLWHPSSEQDNSDSQLQCFQDFSCSAAVRGNGRNVEYALHLLQLAGGNIQEAMLMLMAEPPKLPAGHPMLDYKYQETDQWNAAEVERFCKSILVHDKDFFKVAKDMSTKSVKQCIQFYYVWKKVCPDDYKRLRHSRNKHGNYNTRRQTEKAAAQAAADAAEKSDVQQQQQHQFPASHGQLQFMDLKEEVSGGLVGMEEGEAGPELDTLSTVSDMDDTSMAGPDSIKSLTSTTANSTPTRVESPAPLQAAGPQLQCTYDGCNVICSSKQGLKRHMVRQHGDPGSKPAVTSKPKSTSKPAATKSSKKSRPSTPSRSPVYDEYGEEIFPCKLCDRVFTKVKSRCAHMKSHKIAEQAQQQKANEQMQQEKANEVLSNASYGGF